jgi:hypothetical protein
MSRNSAVNLLIEDRAIFKDVMTKYEFKEVEGLKEFKTAYQPATDAEVVYQHANGKKIALKKFKVKKKVGWKPEPEMTEGLKPFADWEMMNHPSGVNLENSIPQDYVMALAQKQFGPMGYQTENVERHGAVMEFDMVQY